MESQTPEISREFQSENRKLLDYNDEDFNEFPLNELDDDLSLQDEIHADIEPGEAMIQPPKSHKSLEEPPRGKKLDVITVVEIKGFIVTLLNKLTSNGDLWSIKARISDGTAYMDAEFGDDILRSLIGFSVAEMRVSIKCPS
ncbi:hypothetical protein scyTo_0000241 [Scyliorhinus torazame]|uniref:RecQ-mediated genome instability protein 1 C-terminal OB-fold domain-containing protein n=1 Tax=Scyliorhinus torazame TaxID=75743 RepID=A0A401NTD8_SCYTO|nr:hypothetical protein [Scyliorhinus torazame]